MCCTPFKFIGPIYSYYLNTVKLVEQKLNSYLWNGPATGSAWAKVEGWGKRVGFVWTKYEGGLGLFKIHDWNKSLC